MTITARPSPSPRRHLGLLIVAGLAWLAPAEHAAAQLPPPGDAGPAATAGVPGIVPAAAPAPGPAAAPAAGTDKDADGALVRVDVVVTAVSGGNVYLDKGRAEAIEPGDSILLYPMGHSPVPATVRAVSRTSSRAELAPGSPTLAIGDRGEVVMPAARRQSVAPQDAQDGQTAPGKTDHPEWSQDKESFDGTQPLLAPAFGILPEERPMKVYGRVFTQFNGTWDQQNDNSFELWRTGANVTVENPFGQGGQVHVAGDIWRRDSELGSGGGEQTSRARLDRASYLWGGTRYSTERWEVGRFLQHAFPELGVLDGFEVEHRTAGGGLVGGSFGSMPEPFAEMKSGQDVQGAVFYRSDPGDDDPLRFGVAYQNTWHEGAQDRNLFVGTFDADLSDLVSVFGEALVDVYGSGDSVKDKGLEVTEARVNGLWRVDPHTGVGVHVSHVRWPELKRHEFGDLTPEQLQDNEVTRVGADAWHDVTEHLRVNGQVDSWQDQNDTGMSGNLRAALRELLWSRGEVAVDLFITEGAFTKGTGVRVSGNRAIDDIGFATLSWETSSYDSDSVASGGDNLDQQALRASLDRALGEGWTVSLYAERRLGGSTDSYNVGIFVQERF